MKEFLLQSINFVNPKSISHRISLVGNGNKGFNRENLTDVFLNTDVGEENRLDSHIREKSEKLQIVKEVLFGDKSVLEICNRENISHKEFLRWIDYYLHPSKENGINDGAKNEFFLRNKKDISTCTNADVFQYIKNFINFNDDNLSILTDDKNHRFLSSDEISSVVCLKKINDIRYINKFFEQVNFKMSNGSVFIGCMETFKARRMRMDINKIPVLNSVYFFTEFLLKRIIPKLAFSKKYYFDITKGKDRLLSKAEGLGRLVSCGFRIVDFKTIDGILYFVVKKVEEPKFDENPSYGPVYAMPRLGKNGKIFKVYKFRTMHPFSEYLQDYVLNVNGYSSSGKPADDFRIPFWGKFLRKYWLDELPQLLNILKGEMKLVGIRPVSKRYFQDIPKEMQKLRLTQKPGCIPPYVALNREGNVMSVLQAEKEYLVAKIKNPYSTDIYYFFRAVYNIIFKNKRSA